MSQDGNGHTRALLFSTKKLGEVTDFLLGLGEFVMEFLDGLLEMRDFDV